MNTVEKTRAENRARTYLGRLAAAVLVTVCLAVYLWPRAAALQNAEEEIARWLDPGENTVNTVQMLPDTLYRQPFTALGDTLLDLHFPFCGIDPEGDGRISVSVADAAGETLYETVIQARDLTSGLYWTVNDFDYYVSLTDLELSLKKGSTYYLQLFLSDCTGTPISYWSVEAGEEGYENLGPAEIGGAVGGTAIYVEYELYRDHTNEMLPVLLLLALFWLVALFAPARPWCRGAAALLPVFVYLTFEALAGNLAAIQPRYTAYTLLLLYLFLAFLLSALKTAGALLYLFGGLLMGLANYFVLSFRGAPVSVADITAIGTAATVAAGYSYELPTLFLSELLLALCLAVLLVRGGRAAKRRHKQLEEQGWVAQPRFPQLSLPGWAARAAVCGASLLCLAWAFVTLPTSGYDSWRPDSNFSSMGWLYTNCMRLRQRHLQKPDGYTAAAAADLLEQAAEDEPNDAVRPQNLIVIMNESFSDLTVLGDLALNQDALPGLHSLQETAEIGWLAVPVLGGGTCNTEWEVLSGNNKMLTDISFDPYYTFYTEGTPRYNPVSLPSSLSEDGYRTVAIHPCTATNWNRDVAYSQMGFDSFLSDAAFLEPTLVHGWISDQSDYEKIIELYQNKTSDSLFVFNVTMQNHGGYLSNTGDVEKTVWLEDDPDDLETATYLSLIYESDRAFQSLLEYFETVDEPTMIVMFGDHQPSLSPEFYDRLFGTEDLSELPPESRELLFVTPYVIWTNYSRTVKQPVPYMSASYLGAYIKRAAGLETDPYDDFRLAFMQQYPVLGHYGIFDSDYLFTAYDDMSAEQRADLNLLDCVQYYHMTNFEQ